MSSEISIKTKGFESILVLAASIPELLPISAIRPTILAAAEAGKEAGRQSVMRNTGEKATGRLADSIDYEIVYEGERTARVSIGSALEHAKYYVEGVAATNFAATLTGGGLMAKESGVPVMVMPGKWRFIGLRPAMKSHPLLDDITTAFNQALEEAYDENLAEAIRKTDEAQRAVKDVEEDLG